MQMLVCWSVLECALRCGLHLCELASLWLNAWLECYGCGCTGAAACPYSDIAQKSLTLCTDSNDSSQRLFAMCKTSNTTPTCRRNAIRVLRKHECSSLRQLVVIKPHIREGVLCVVICAKLDQRQTFVPEDLYYECETYKSCVPKDNSTGFAQTQTLMVSFNRQFHDVS